MNQKNLKKSMLTTLLHLPFKIIFSRFTLTLFAVLIQCGLIYISLSFFSRYFVWIFGGSTILGIILAIYLINQENNPSFQLSWIILILVFPTLGIFIYLFVKMQVGVRAISSKICKVHEEIACFFHQKKQVLETIDDASILQCTSYIKHTGGYPIYQNTNVKYYPLGDDVLKDLLRDLENAKKYIFLEFFIIAKGKFWDSVLEILKKKAQEGIEVKILYDGTCSFMLLPKDYPEELKKYGIEAKIFNPVVPIISTHYNNRDHRKIVVVDGKIGYTGGINIADEYINEIERFGHWKDNAIRLDGEAVQNLIYLFLESWNLTCKESLETKKYLQNYPSKGGGYVLPFGDHPFDSFQVGEQMYSKLISNAKKEIKIMTPYFIADYTMISNLCNASLSGVEVSLMLPGIPDKPILYYIARTFYSSLLDAGVKIYEYTPGFLHAKMILTDCEKAILGTINFDFRSLYLNFENAVLLYQDSSILKMFEDYDKTILKCHEVTKNDIKNYPLWQKIIGKILRVFAPLL